MRNSFAVLTAQDKELLESKAVTLDVMAKMKGVEAAVLQQELNESTKPLVDATTTGSYEIVRALTVTEILAAAKGNSVVKFSQAGKKTISKAGTYKCEVVEMQLDNDTKVKALGFRVVGSTKRIRLDSDAEKNVLAEMVALGSALTAEFTLKIDKYSRESFMFESATIII